MPPPRWLWAPTASLLAAAPVAAQHTTGLLHGTVTDPFGALLGGALVQVLGTSHRAQSDSAGRYLLPAVPAGTYTLAVEYASRGSAEVGQVTVWAGEARRLDLRLTADGESTAPPAAGEGSGFRTSQSLIPGALFRILPVLDPAEVIALQAGVFQRPGDGAVSLRGAAPGDAAIYVDGAPLGGLLLGAEAIEQAGMTAGALGPDVGDGASGAISYVTRGGSGRFDGSLRYRSDEAGFDLWRAIGLNRVEASLSAPLRDNLTMFSSLTLTGRRSLETQALRDVQAPVYVIAGVDTVVHQPVSVGDPFSDTVDVAIPRFAQYSGYCDAATNYGVECQGLEVPFTAHGRYAWQGKLRHTYGAASSMSVTGLASAAQERFYPGVDLYNPEGHDAGRATAAAAILDWTHQIGAPRGGPLLVNLNLSYQSENWASGPLTRQSELDSRDPLAGFLLAPLAFLVDANTTHDVTIGATTYPGVGFLDDRQIDCLLVGTAMCQDLVPFLDRDDLGAAQPYRLNPYAAEQSLRYPLYTSGIDDAQMMDLGRERRWHSRATVTWHPGAFHRLRLGGELRRFDVARYQASLRTSSFMSAYHEQPVRQGAFIEDRIELGDLVLHGGVRYDRFDSRALYPIIPGRISSASGSIVVDGETITFEPFDPTDPTANMVPAQVHTALSPRVHAAYRILPSTTVRFGLARQVQVPEFDALFRGKNTDISVSNPNQVFGRDLGFVTTTVTELGVRHAFRRVLVADLAAFIHRRDAEIVQRLVRLPDPGQGGTLRDFRVFSDVDYGTVRGVQLSVGRRVSSALSGSLAYTYWTTLEDDAVTTPGGAPAPLRPTGRGHTVVGWMTLAVPAEWRARTVLGRVLANTEATATFRWTSGAPYTRIRNNGDGYTVGASPLEFSNIEPINASNLPWTKTVDVRVTRGFTLGRVRGRVFAESQNLFNWTNLLNLFIETGETTNPQYRARFVDEQVANLENQAANAGWLRTDGTGANYIDFTAGSCADWRGRNTQGSAASGPVDCVLLTRAEARFGNGDGVYTRAEYSSAFGAWYDLAQAPYQFYGPGRRIRLGVAIAF